MRKREEVQKNKGLRHLRVWMEEESWERKKGRKENGNGSLKALTWWIEDVVLKQR